MDPFLDSFDFKTGSDLEHEKLKNTECLAENEQLTKEIKDYRDKMFELGERIVELDESEKLMGAERNEWIQERFQELLGERNDRP